MHIHLHSRADFLKIMLQLGLNVGRKWLMATKQKERHLCQAFHSQKILQSKSTKGHRQMIFHHADIKPLVKGVLI